MRPHRPLLLLLTALAALACDGDPARPNLLLVTVDTLRADALACYGGRRDVGVELCALFDAGLRYRWAFSAAPYTAPSIASMLTSRYPVHHGVTQTVTSYLGDDQISVAELLLGAGYQPAAFISNPVLERRRNLGQGFEVYDQQMTRRERNRPRYVEREAQATTDAALAWAQVGLREPWFVWVHFQDPHGPYDPPEARPRRDPPGATHLRVLEDHSGRGGIPAYQVLPQTFTERAYTERYRDEIRYLDPHIARLVTGLEALGAPPAILLTSDHGESFGEDDFWFAHGHSVGLDQIRVPLLFRPPQRVAGRVVEEPVTLLDVAPTLLSLAGIPIPAEFLGSPLPRESPGEDRPLFAEHGRQAAVVFGGRVFSRDRATIAGRREQELGNKMPALPARFARLGADDALPAYEAPGDDETQHRVEAMLDSFLDGTVKQPTLHRGQVSDDVRERMRALGYVDE